MSGRVDLLVDWRRWGCRLAEPSGSASLSDRGGRTEVFEPRSFDDDILGPWLLSLRPLATSIPNVFRLPPADGDLDCFEEILESAEET